MMRENYATTDSPLRSPMPQDCDRIIRKFDDQFKKIEPLIDELLRNHRRYVVATGDAKYFVRAIHALGRGLIEDGGDNPHARVQKAQSIAREGLQWQPYDRYLWSLWRDAFASDHVVEAAELIGWEMIRRDPTHVDARNQLATILVNSLGKLDEAETLLRETIEKFPDNPVARGEFSELLIFQNRVAEAASILDATVKMGIEDEPIFAARARIFAFEGDLENARRTITRGLDFDPSYPVLKKFEQYLARGEMLPLKSHTFRRVDSRERVRARATTAADVADVARLGNMRRLRFHLEFGPKNEQETALEELRKILREDPTFAYAELLAARHRIWEASADALPSFATAFEDALVTEDREKLKTLAIRQPRLEALILVARALYGDTEAEQKVELWLRETEITEKESAIAGLHSALRPILRAIEGGRSVKDAFVEARNTVISALHDANEAALGEMLLAA